MRTEELEKLSRTKIGDSSEYDDAILVVAPFKGEITCVDCYFFNKGCKNIPCGRFNNINEEEVVFVEQKG